MRKSLIPLLLITTLALAGCIGKSTDDRTPGPQEDELFILHEGGMNSHREALDHVVREFEAKYPHIQVHIHEVQNSDIARNEDPSVYDGFDLVIGQGWIPYRLQRMDLALDMGALDLPPLDSIAVELAMVDGQMAWVPIEMRTYIYVLHEETLTRLGIEIPGINWTYAEYDEVMRKLHAADRHDPLNYRTLYSSAILAFGGGFYDPTTEQWTFDTPENREALGFMRRMADGGLWTTDLHSRIEMFGDDLTPLWLAESRQLPMDGWIARPFPVGPAGRVATSFIPRGVAILNTTVRPEVATMFVREMLNSTAYAEAGVRPTVDNPAALALWEERVGAETALVITEAWNSMRRSPAPPQSFDYMNPIGRYLDGEMSLDELIHDLYAQAP